MLKFWEERERDLKTHHALRAQELAVKHFALACPVKFAETVFPGIKLLECQKRILCLMRPGRNKRAAYISMPRAHGRGLPSRIMQIYMAHYQGAAS